MLFDHCGSSRVYASKGILSVAQYWQVGHNYDNYNMLAEAFNVHIGRCMTCVDNKSSQSRVHKTGCTKCTLNMICTQ